VNNFIALCSFVLALLGVDLGASTQVHRAVADGIDTLYSRTTVEAGVARFECLRSASGQCHYAVLASGCASGPDATECATAVDRFTVASGHSRQIPGLRRFDLCVGTEPGEAVRDCDLPEPIAGR
jgi:hypothetical protein